MADRTIDYLSPATRDHQSTSVTCVAFVVTLLLPVMFVSFVLLRRYQLSLPDPYNNPYADLSTACLLALPVLALADAILVAAWWRRIARAVSVFALILIGLVGLFVVCLVVGAVRFVSP